MRIIIICAFFGLLSCESESNNSLSNRDKAKMVDSIKESYINNSNKEMELEAKKGEFGSPVKIRNCRISDDKVISIQYQNISDKEIDAVKVAIFAYDNFEEYREVNMGFPFITATSQKTVRPGKSINESLDAYSFKGVTKLTCYVVKVHYKAGGVWENNNWLK